MTSYKPTEVGTVSHETGNGSVPIADTTGTVPVPCMGWPFPMLKYKCIFRIKNTRKQLYQTALGNCYDLKLPKCRLQFKGKNTASFIIIFGTVSSGICRSSVAKRRRKLKKFSERQAAITPAKHLMAFQRVCGLKTRAGCDPSLR